MLTPSKLKQIRTSMINALSNVEEEHNMQFDIGNISYTNTTFKVTLQAAIAEEGQVANLAKTEWDRYCSQYGFTKNDYGEPFETDSGKHCTISGIKPRSTKYPILGKCEEDGKEYKFPAKVIRRYLLEMERDMFDGRA